MGQFLDWIYSLFPLIERGGWVMWPIIFCSLTAFAIIVERTWFLIVRSNRITSRAFIREVEAHLDNSDLENAVVACRKNNSMMARVLLEGLALYGSSREIIREAFEDAGRRESRELERFLGTLAAIAGVSPLLGLLGTVIGMIEIFHEIASRHIGQYESLAGGIYVALYTTAAGLIVAIPAYLAFRGFQGIADTRLRDMEDLAVDILNRLDRVIPENDKNESESKERER